MTIPASEGRWCLVEAFVDAVSLVIHPVESPLAGRYHAAGADKKHLADIAPAIRGARLSGIRHKKQRFS